MGTPELRDKISEYVSTADDKVLRIVKAVFETYEESLISENDTTPEIFKALIKEGLKDSDAGRTRPHSEVMADIREKYNIAR